MRILVAAALGVALGWASQPSREPVRIAANKAIALLQTSEKNWYAKQVCYSCHHQLLPALAFRAAREHGLTVDEKLAYENVARGLAPYASLDRAVQYTHMIDPTMDDANRLIALDAVGVKPNLTTAVYARLIALRQRPDGHWVTSDQRPPQSYSYITATANALRALQLYHHASLAADTKSRIDKAASWLRAQTPRNTEERTYRLWGLYWAGADRADLSKIAAELASSQRADGGWNSVTGRESDAYSTGEALVVLHDAGGLATTDPVWSRGIEFLLKTQQPDGSWHVSSRLHPPAQVSPPYFETGYPYAHDQFISAMGASWSVIALAETLGPAKRAATVTVKEAEPAAPAPWVETMLFGSAADVRGLLDKKFDPNSATPEGTSALMLAMPSLEKARLLLDHGANVNARSTTRFSALLVAAQYPHSSDVMKLLLAKGAQVRLPKGEGAPLFGATALGLASMSGNADMVHDLIAKGDRLDDKYTFIGLFPGPFVLAPLGFDDDATMTAMLDAGLPVDLTDGDGLSLLDWAVIANRTSIARLLIARGAKVNITDKFGMTPLLYAASIDYGDSAMTELLVKSGANKKAATKDGLTAAQLARKYSNANLAAALQ